MNFLQKIWALEPIHCRRLLLTFILTGTVTTPDITPTYFGDWDANTIVGVETEDSDAGGITKISDVPEDFSYTKDLTSHIDGQPIGALHWKDLAYDPAVALQKVKDAYNGVTAVKPIASEQTLFVYPNPAKSVLNVKNAKNADITIMNLDGRVVKSVKNVSSVSVSDLADGMYTVTIKDGNSVSKQKVLIAK
jgi:hypothetical protein